MTPQDAEIVVHSERYTIEIPTKCSKRSTSGRSTSAGKTLDGPSKENTAKIEQSFLTKDSKSTLENPPASGQPS